jgi:hypothetical protein
MPPHETTYTMGALGRRVYDRVNVVAARAVAAQSPAMCAVEAYIDPRPHPDQWRSAVDDCWKNAEEQLKRMLVDIARALDEIDMARGEIRHAPE